MPVWPSPFSVFVKTDGSFAALMDISGLQCGYIHTHTRDHCWCWMYDVFCNVSRARGGSMDNSKMAMMGPLRPVWCWLLVSMQSSRQLRRRVTIKYFQVWIKYFPAPGSRDWFPAWQLLRSAATHILILFSTPNVGALLIPAPAACTQAATTFMVT